MTHPAEMFVSLPDLRQMKADQFSSGECGIALNDSDAGMLNLEDLPVSVNPLPADGPECFPLPVLASAVEVT